MKKIYLFLALACFLGIVLIFIFDGYMGVYDSFQIDTGQYPQDIDADQWQRQDSYGFYPSMNIDRDAVANITYTVENHRFSAYSAGVAVSLFFGTDKIGDLAAGQVSVGAFGKGSFNWILRSADYLPASFPSDQPYKMTMVVKRGDVERKIMVYINPGPQISKPVITVPAPPAD